MRIESLAHFKRLVAAGATLTLIEAKRKELTLIEAKRKDNGGPWQEFSHPDTPGRHRYLNVPRTAPNTTPNSSVMSLVDSEGNASRMEFGKASNWTFNGNIATFEEHNEKWGYGTRLVYEVTP